MTFDLRTRAGWCLVVVYGLPFNFKFVLSFSFDYETITNYFGNKSYNYERLPVAEFALPPIKLLFER